MMVTLGKHQGGELLHWPQDDGNFPIGELPWKEATMLDPHRNPVFFDGTKAHETAEFDGPRLSLIFFKTRWYEKVNLTTIQELSGLGFAVQDPLKPRQRRVNAMRANSGREWFDVDHDYCMEVNSGVPMDDSLCHDCREDQAVLLCPGWSGPCRYRRALCRSCYESNRGMRYDCAEEKRESGPRRRSRNGFGDDDSR